MNLFDKKVDIIIPIYNAFDELTRCMESIWKWTDLNNNRLILINDKSPDERIQKYLDEIQHENVVVVHNKENRGFPANINIGMAQSEENDVVLLNSDTVVTKGWLEKLRICAYSECMIASVTPLSNNATLCSVPNFCEENLVPDGYTVDEYAELIEKISMKKYPQIPVGHGFCMYVKREVIKKIGDFDAETFGRGYGEENDFCYRAIEAGYHHVMCDDTFILHTGTSSFVSEEKRKAIEMHERILDERYPELMQNVRIHCRDNPNAFVQENVKLWIKLNRMEKRETIMYLVQADFREDALDNVGGTQLHVKDLVFGVRKNFDVVVAARNGVYLNVTLYTREEQYFFKYYIGTQPVYEQFRSEQFAELYGKILDNFGVDCVHIHHTIGLTLELFYEARKRKLPIYATMHDYYYVCPTVKMLDQSDELCVGKADEEKCKQCLNKHCGIAMTIPYISIWREENLAALRLVNRIFVPSLSAKNIVGSYFDELQNKIEIIEHGAELILPEKISREEKKTFNVAFLGGISVAKGYRYTVDLIKKGNKGIKWHLFGIFERENTSVERRNNFVNVGKYKREDLPRLFQEYSIDLVCILAIWPETFCYTISEAIMCGVPVLVTDVGALGERVKSMKCGWVVPHGEPSDAILKKINEIRINRDEYQGIIKNISQIKHRTIDEMCEDYCSRYKATLQERHIGTYDGEWLLEGYATASGDRILMGGKQNTLEMQLCEAETQLARIQSSFSYRLIKKIVSINWPFRSQIKSLLRNVYKVIRKRK